MTCHAFISSCERQTVYAKKLSSGLWLVGLVGLMLRLEGLRSGLVLRLAISAAYQPLVILSSSVIIVATPFFPVLAFHNPGILSDPEDISSLCPN